MRRARPARISVAGETQRRTGVVHDEKLAELIVMWIVAGDALNLAEVVELDFFIERRRILHARVLLREVLIVNEGDRMIAGKVRSQIGRAGRHRDDAALE